MHGPQTRHQGHPGLQRPPWPGKRWLARWVGDDGQERARSFGRKSQAQAHIVEITTLLTTGSYADPHRGAITFDTVDHRLAGVQGESQAQDQSGLRKRSGDGGATDVGRGQVEGPRPHRDSTVGVLVGRAPRRAHAQIHRHAQDRTVGGAGDPGHQVVHQVLRYAVMSKLIAAIPPSISSSPVRTPSATRRSRPNRWRRWRTLPPTATRSCASWSTRLPTPAYLLLCHMGIGCPMAPDPTGQFRSIPGHWRPITTTGFSCRTRRAPPGNFRTTMPVSGSVDPPERSTRRPRPDPNQRSCGPLRPKTGCMLCGAVPATTLWSANGRSPLTADFGAVPAIAGRRTALTSWWATVRLSGVEVIAGQTRSCGQAGSTGPQAVVEPLVLKQTPTQGLNTLYSSRATRAEMDPPGAAFAAVADRPAGRLRHTTGSPTESVAALAEQCDLPPEQRANLLPCRAKSVISGPLSTGTGATHAAERGQRVSGGQDSNL